MASLLFTPEWRDLCPSGLPPQILPQLQFTSITWGGELSVVLSQQSRQLGHSLEQIHIVIYLFPAFFFLCCYCAYHGWDLKFFVCTLLDTFTRIGGLRTDRRIPSFLHRLFPEGAALPQLRASIAVAEQHHLSRQAPVPAPAIAVGYRKPPVSQGNKTILFSPITDTRCKAHHFLRTALQTLTRVRTVEGQCAKILLEQQILPSQARCPVPMPQTWKVGHPLSREMQMLFKFQFSPWHLNRMISVYVCVKEQKISFNCYL